MRADSGWVGWTGDGELIDACAVLADNEEVGGPEEKIDLLGVLNNDIVGVGEAILVGFGTCVGEARSGVEFGCGGRGEKMDPSARPAGPGEGVFLADVDAGKVQVGS